MRREKRILAARIREELADLERLVARVMVLFEKARRTGDDDYLDGVALNLHGFYTGVERIFEEIAREVDGAIPGGAEWHRELALQMAAEVPGVRPSVVGGALRECLAEFRGFRHVVRNVYTFNLLPARVKELIALLGPCFEALKSDLIRFTGFLVMLDEE